MLTVKATKRLAFEFNGYKFNLNPGEELLFAEDVFKLLPKELQDSFKAKSTKLPPFYEGEDLKGKTIVVFTNGCFDILHAAHADYLKKAKYLGDILAVGINSDASVKSIKREKRPILPQQMHAYLVDSLKPVDYVVIFEGDTPLELIKAIRPDVLVKGTDWDLDKIVGADFVLSYGGKVERITFSFDISTSKVIERILRFYCG